MLNTAIIFHPFSLFGAGFSKLRLHFPAIQRSKERLEFKRKLHKLLNGFLFIFHSVSYAIPTKIHWWMVVFATCSPVWV